MEYIHLKSQQLGLSKCIYFIGDKSLPSLFAEWINDLHVKPVVAPGKFAKKKLWVFSASERAHTIWIFKDQNKIHYLVLNEAVVLMQYKSNCRQSLNHN